jgi:hypothetical protein
MTDVAELVSYTSIFSLLLPLGAYFYGKRRTRLTETVFILAFGSFAFEIANEIYVWMGNRDQAVVNIYFLFQFAGYSAIFLQFAAEMRKVVAAGAVILLALFAFNLRRQPFTELQTNTDAVENVLFIVYTFLGLYFIFRNPARAASVHPSILWIALAVFSYALLTVYIFFLASFVFRHLPGDYGKLLWVFHNAANVLKNVLFAIGIAKAGKPVNRNM